MTKSRGSSNRWLRRQGKDPYVEQAARDGWRSRAVYKLQQLQTRERVLRPGGVCVDLGSSPGGWSQFAAHVVGPQGRVVAVDLLEMPPIDGVAFIQGDFTSAPTLAELRGYLEERQVDLVLSDMAPNISGQRTVDQARSMSLADEALLFATEALEPGGDFVVKLFQGEGFNAFVEGARGRFKSVRIIKPKASRPESREVYLVARRYAV